jgi:hypothetical protein
VRARVIAQTDLFAGGSVRFPRRAAWLEDFTAELLAFPGRHDDQVDALTQGLAWGRVRRGEYSVKTVGGRFDRSGRTITGCRFSTMGLGQDGQHGQDGQWQPCQGCQGYQDGQVARSPCTSTALSACTHKSGLMSNDWPMTAIPPRADIEAIVGPATCS